MGQELFISTGTLGNIIPEFLHNFMWTLDKTNVNKQVNLLITTRFKRDGHRLLDFRESPEFSWQQRGYLTEVIDVFNTDLLPRLTPEELSYYVLFSLEAEPGELPAQHGEKESGLISSIYQVFYQLGHMPFSNTPDPQFFYPSEGHTEALSRLIYTISEKKGLALITGEIGTGKTLLCHAVAGHLPLPTVVATILPTPNTPDQLLQAILKELGLSSEGRSAFELRSTLNTFLLEQQKKRKTVVLIVDEAQNLPTEVLEEVRLLSNLETKKEKLLQIILVGQPELKDKLIGPQMRSLRQRISVQYHLKPLTERQTEEYIFHRLKIAGPDSPITFTPKALRQVFGYSRGVPRLINSICDNALLTGYVRQTLHVTDAVITEAARDINLCIVNSNSNKLIRKFGQKLKNLFRGEK